MSRSGLWGWPRSFGAKISLLTTVVSGAAILATSLALSASQYLLLRRQTLGALASQAPIVAMNSSAPLAFSDRASAQDALSAFASLPAVAAATMYDAKEAAFATYVRRGGAQPPPLENLHESLISQSWRRELVPIAQKGERLGTLEVVYDLEELRENFWYMLGFSTALAAFAVALVLLVSLRLRRSLLAPVDALSRTARTVSATKNYAQRAPRLSDDEIGEFADVFNQMLEQIQKQDLDLQASRQEALRASRLKDEFLATLSHELRAPMAPIVGWAQVLKLGVPDPARIAQGAEVIERNARAQNKIIEDLLDMSRIVSGKIKLDVHNLDLADVAARAIETLAAAAAQKGIAIEQDLPRGVALLSGDPYRLQQVIWNLLSNAVKFSSSGARVAIALRRGPGDVELSVRDSGPGIEPEFLPHVFERFRQADSSTTRTHQGLGLGLAIAQQLAELHGGTLTVASAGLGHGATFTLTLPIVSLHMAAAAPALPAATPNSLDTPLHGLRVMLVDDDADTRGVIKDVLELAGATVSACDCAAAVLDGIDAFAPDVLISDIAMPVLDGYALMRRVRDGGGHFCGIPAIALTAFAGEEDQRRAHAAGFCEHVSKPVDIESLIGAVRRAAAQLP
jgi:signal transduction histidine kinase